MITKVKICGIRTVENARSAILAGADYIGLIFVRQSKRYIEPEDAASIVRSVGDCAVQVGVFEAIEPAEINRIVSVAGLQLVQLYGLKNPEEIAQIKSPVIRAIRVAQNQTPDGVIQTLRASGASYALLDRETQGAGALVDYELAHEVSGSVPTFLAGGLTPENVGEAIRRVRPFAVDVASGVETDGYTDPLKITNFIQSVKGAYI